MLERSIGIEAEFILLGKEDKAIVPPSNWNRDGFPLLGEIRGKPGKSVADVVASFFKEKLLSEARVRKGHQIVYSDITRVPLATYQQAMKQVTKAKGEDIGKVKNIYGINIDDFSDQIISKGKIQGIHASCGLHIHFSCIKVDQTEIFEDEYEPVILPLGMTMGNNTNIEDLADAIIRPEIRLYKLVKTEVKKTLKATANQLNRPAVEWIVKQMDEKFFDRFAPAKDKRTKYRQPGFYELKPHGFEYRSLPANSRSLEDLPEIVKFALGLLDSLNEF